VTSLRLPDNIIEDPQGGHPRHPASVATRPSSMPTFRMAPRKHLSEREAQRAKDSAVAGFSQRLTARGVAEQAIQDAVAEIESRKLSGSVDAPLQAMKQCGRRSISSTRM
jgi:hypothetical protein